jgi:hypothetical protein
MLKSVVVGNLLQSVNFIHLFRQTQGLKFAVSRYPRETKNLVLDTKLWNDLYADWIIITFQTLRKY